MYSIRDSQKRNRIVPATGNFRGRDDSVGLGLISSNEEMRTNKKCQLFLSLGSAVDKWAWELWKMTFGSHLVALAEDWILSVTSGQRLKPEFKILRFILRFPDLGKRGGLVSFSLPLVWGLWQGKNENPWNELITLLQVILSQKTESTGNWPVDWEGKKKVPATREAIRLSFSVLLTITFMFITLEILQILLFRS